MDRPLFAPAGLTVAALKQIVRDLPEHDEDGQAFTVWIGNAEGLSSEVKEVWPLDSDRAGHHLLFK